MKLQQFPTKCDFPFTSSFVMHNISSYTTICSFKHLHTQKTFVTFTPRNPYLMAVKSIIADETRFLAFILRLQHLFPTPVFCVKTANLRLQGVVTSHNPHSWQGVSVSIFLEFLSYIHLQSITVLSMASV